MLLLSLQGLTPPPAGSASPPLLSAPTSAAPAVFQPQSFANARQPAPMAAESAPAGSAFSGDSMSLLSAAAAAMTGRHADLLLRASPPTASSGASDESEVADDDNDDDEDAGNDGKEPGRRRCESGDAAAASYAFSLAGERPACGHGPTSCFCRCPFTNCGATFLNGEAFVEHVCGKLHRFHRKALLGVWGCIFRGCHNRRSVWKKCYLAEHLLVQHFKIKRHQCPECGERFSQKKNLFGKGGHCTPRPCRHCGAIMTCLTRHRVLCRSGAACSDDLPPQPAALDAVLL